MYKKSYLVVNNGVNDPLKLHCIQYFLTRLNIWMAVYIL